MKIAIVTGGTTGEREISFASAQNIEAALSNQELRVFVLPEEQELFEQNVSQFDFVVPMIHGVGGEDGKLQDWIKENGISFVFSGSSASSIAIDKEKMKQLVSDHGIRTPKTFASSSIEVPCFIKPKLGGSSVDTCRANTLEEALEFLVDRNHENYIIEQAIDGREFTVGVIENASGKTEALPVAEIIPKGDTFFDYDSKYNVDNLAEEICPAEIDSALELELQQAALQAHELISARHMTRSDFLVDPDNQVYFLEINTIPGMTDTSLIPKALKVAGYDLGQLMDHWMH